MFSYSRHINRCVDVDVDQQIADRCHGYGGPGTNHLNVRWNTANFDRTRSCAMLIYYLNRKYNNNKINRNIA